MVLSAALSDTALAQGELRNVGCAQEYTLRSVDDVTATEVTFFNQSPTPVRTYWLDYDGKRVFRAEIRPGDSFVQQTYVTHPWVITSSAAKRCVGVFQPTSSASVVVIH